MDLNKKRNNQSVINAFVYLNSWLYNIILYVTLLNNTRLYRTLLESTALYIALVHFYNASHYNTTHYTIQKHNFFIKLHFA